MATYNVVKLDTIRGCHMMRKGHIIDIKRYSF